MARLIADENVRLRLVEALRSLGHDVVTAHEAGRANQGISDREILAHATGLGRAVLTNNRRHFHRLHRQNPGHAGMVTFTDDANIPALAQRIHTAISAAPTLTGQLIKIIRTA